MFKYITMIVVMMFIALPLTQSNYLHAATPTSVVVPEKKQRFEQAKFKVYDIEMIMFIDYKTGIACYQPVKTTGYIGWSCAQRRSY